MISNLQHTLYILLLRTERHTLAGFEQRAVRLRTAIAVIDAVAVANCQVGFGAKPPNRLLHQPGEECRALRTELAGVDVPCRFLDDAGATTWPVAVRSVRVLGT